MARSDGGMDMWDVLKEIAKRATGNPKNPTDRKVKKHVDKALKGGKAQKGGPYTIKPGERKY